MQLCVMTCLECAWSQPILRWLIQPPVGSTGTQVWWVSLIVFMWFTAAHVLAVMHVQRYLSCLGCSNLSERTDMIYTISCSIRLGASHGKVNSVGTTQGLTHASWTDPWPSASRALTRQAPACPHVQHRKGHHGTQVAQAHGCSPCRCAG